MKMLEWIFAPLKSWFDESSFSGIKEIDMLDGSKKYLAYYKDSELGYAMKVFGSDLICTCIEGGGDECDTREEAEKILKLYLKQNRK